MKLWREIFTQIGGEDTGENVFGGNYTVAIGQGGYFQNIKRILAFSPSEVTLALQRGQLKITGRNLLVAKYCEGDVFLRGSIDSVIYEGVKRGNQEGEGKR